MDNAERIKEKWEETGEKLSDKPATTLRDTNQAKIEIDAISRHLNKEEVLLDAGCGTGYATSIFAEHVKKTFGMDYSKTMVDGAKKRWQGLNEDLKGRLEFEEGDIMNIPHEDESFDVVVTQRSLINLDTWEKQQKGLLEIHRVLKKGGKLLMLEGIKQGYEQLNKRRSAVGLDEIKVAWHNLSIDENKFLPFIEKYFDVSKVEKFGMYFFISRLIHPLLVKPEEPKYDAKINDVAYKINSEVSQFDEISPIALYVLKKKS